MSAIELLRAQKIPAAQAKEKEIPTSAGRKYWRTPVCPNGSADGGGWLTTVPVVVGDGAAGEDGLAVRLASAEARGSVDAEVIAAGLYYAARSVAASTFRIAGRIFRCTEAPGVHFRIAARKLTIFIWSFAVS